STIAVVVQEDPRVEVKKAASRGELKGVILVAFLTVAALYATMTWCPSTFQLYAICGVMLVAALNLFSLGRAWQRRREETEAATRQHLENANGTLRRLSGKRK